MILYESRSYFGVSGFEVLAHTFSNPVAILLTFIYFVFQY